MRSMVQIVWVRPNFGFGHVGVSHAVLTLHLIAPATLARGVLSTLLADWGLCEPLGDFYFILKTPRPQF